MSDPKETKDLTETAEETAAPAKTKSRSIYSQQSD